MSGFPPPIIARGTVGSLPIFLSWGGSFQSMAPFGLSLALSLGVISPVVGLASEPLAKCRVQSVRGSSTPTAMQQPGIVIQPADEENPLDDYQPQQLSAVAGSEGASGSANEDAMMGANAVANSQLRVVIRGPKETRLLELHVYMDGLGYVAARNAWIDDILESVRSGKAALGDQVAGAISTVRTALSGDDMSTRTRVAPTLRRRALSYLSAVGSDVDREEVGWLMEKWSAGTPVTLLSPGRSWERFGIAPVWDLLDLDGNGAIDPQEQGACTNTLQEADIDEDGVVELREIKRRLSKGKGRAVAPTRPLLELSPSDTNLTSPESHPGMRAEVRFASSGNAPGEVLLTNLAKASVVEIPSTEEVIVIESGACRYELCACATLSRSWTDSPPQVAVGAVVEGYPVWRRLNADGDARLTASELRALPELLSDLDLNGDNEITAEERPLTIRIAVGHGPVVHQVLGEATRAPEASIPDSPINAPEWFTSMDANTDGELTRQEFAGATDQFRALDQDGNGVITAMEAAPVTTEATPVDEATAESAPQEESAQRPADEDTTVEPDRRVIENSTTDNPSRESSD